MNTYTVTLPLPPRVLHPNYTVGSKGGRMAKSTATKKYRSAAGLMMSAQWAGPGPKWKAASVQCVFYFPTKRRRDRDGMLSSMKAAFDGFADAGLVENDADFTYLPVRAMHDKAKPRVEVTVQEVP